MDRIFIAFAYPDYYPRGGMHDCYGVFFNLEAALDARPRQATAGTNIDILHLPEMVLYEYEVNRNGVFLLAKGPMQFKA